MYSGTYVPVVMNMPAGSPEEQMLYYYGAPFYVMPPQQYSVHPTGLNTFYNVLPGPTTPTNGMLYYNDQDVHNQTQFPMIPPLQQHLSTMRKRKTIVVRDPNQDHKDMEEIISEAGRSRKPTLPVGNDFSVPVPLQQLDQVVELNRVYYVDRAQGPPAPADLEPDEQLESYSVPYAALDGAEKPTSSAEPGPAQAITPTPDKTEPVQVPPEVPASVLFTIDEPAESDTAPRPDDSQFLREDKPELAFQQSDFDLEPVSTTVETYSVSPVIVLHLASAETPADELVEQEAEPPKNEPEPSSGDESNDGVLSPVEDPINNTMPGPSQAVTSKPYKTEPVQVPSEVPASALITIDGPAETDTAPRPDDSKFLREDKPELAFQQSDFDLEPVSTTVENYSVSPVIVEHLASAETPADEIVEQEAEPPKNEPEPSSGDESNDGVLLPVEDPINNTMPGPSQAVTSKPDKTEPVQVPSEVTASALITIDEPAETDTAPRPDDSQFLREDKPELAFQQSDFDLEPVSTTVENYSVSPVIVEHLASAETPADEIVEQKVELLKNEPEPSSEDESNDGVLSPVEDPINNTMHKPEMENKRIQYGREFLLSMQFMPDCMQKPEGLPFIPDVVLRKCNQNRLPPDPQRLISRDPFFIPAFADNRSMIPNEKRAPQPNAIWRRPPPSKSPLNVPMNEEVKLKKAENAWKPRIKSSNSTKNLETQKTEKLFRTVRSILNKLTPEMFDQLMKQVKELHIDTEERLKGVVNLIFENAIDEPNFSMGYGIMCKSLAAINVPMANKPHSNVNFQRLLLNCCQKEFDKDKTSNDVLDKKQRELEAAVSASERERLQDELEEAKNKTRRKTKGNVKFIGELFKLRLLTESIIHNCVVKLLKKNDEESLECLSILLTTAGKEMDVKKAKVQMDKYFKKMEEIVKGKKTSSRVRFMLQDVIYLRLNNWVPRRVVEGPKTIESIHMDAKLEQEEEQRIVQEKLRSMGPTRRVFSSHKTMNTVRMNSTLDPNKIPKIKKFPADDKIYLGPNFERRRLNWKNGCNEETSARATSGASVKLDAVPDLTTNKPELSEEEMEKRSKSIIEEFLHINNYKEALHCVEELDQGRMLYLFVQVGVETTLERNQITRDHMGHLFHQMLQAGILSTSQFFKGFSETLQIADDMAIDIPYIWQYIAELVNPVLRKGGISLRELLIEFSKPLLPVARAGILSAEILHLLCKQMSQTEVGALWGDSKLSWADFLPETVDVNNFITEQVYKEVKRDHYALGVERL